MGLGGQWLSRAPRQQALLGEPGPPRGDDVRNPPPGHPDQAPGRRIAESVKRACRRAAVSAYEDARIRGLCGEGAFEAAMGAIGELDVAPCVEEAEPEECTSPDDPNEEALHP